MIPTSQRDAWLPGLCSLAERAGDVVMQVYAGAPEVRTKGDTSPVTDADERAEALILAGLAALAPGVPVVAEEEVAAGRVPAIGGAFWLVDPLDGTREFVQRNGEFTVNIALVDHGMPVLGMVLAPALGRLYAGVPGQGAWVEDRQGRRQIRVRPVPDDGLTVVGSRHHGDESAVRSFLAGRRIAANKTVGSSLKLCLVAAGEADVYARFGRTMEWDIAAGDAILRAAGGAACTLDGALLTYGTPAFANPDFAAWGAAPA